MQTLASSPLDLPTQHHLAIEADSGNIARVLVGFYILFEQQTLGLCQTRVLDYQCGGYFRSHIRTSKIWLIRLIFWRRCLIRGSPWTVRCITVGVTSLTSCKKDVGVSPVFFKKSQNCPQMSDYTSLPLYGCPWKPGSKRWANETSSTKAGWKATNIRQTAKRFRRTALNSKMSILVYPCTFDSSA
jgi:hypothetical protein